MDNLFFRTISKMVDLVWLNLLTLICALPVITAGASLTAMYSVLLRMAENEEGKITSRFFASYKENFVNATKVWICVLAIGAVCLANLTLIKKGVMGGMPGIARACTICIVIIILILVAFLLYFLPLLGRYDQTLPVTCKNAFLLASAYLPRTLCMMIISLFPVALMLLSNYFLWLWFLYGLSFSGYFSAMLLVRIFEKTEKVSANES